MTIKPLPINSPHQYKPSAELGLQNNWELPIINTNLQDLVPSIDENYIFNENVASSILAGFIYGKKVMVHGLHGTGKSTHIEQIAARLNWPVIRVNFDGNLSRSDFLGRDYLVLREDKQIMEFREGILPYAIQNPIALILDEYDAARPEFLFILQRLLEDGGKLLLVDENKVITPHPDFRIFATSNTIGSGDYLGIYAGTNEINQAQLDRWNIVTVMDYLPKEVEKNLINKKIPEILNIINHDDYNKYFDLFELIRKSFKSGEINYALSPRTIISWAENSVIFKNPIKALFLSFIDRLTEEERILIAELYQRCFGKEL